MRTAHGTARRFIPIPTTAIQLRCVAGGTRLYMFRDRFLNIDVWIICALARFPIARPSLALACRYALHPERFVHCWLVLSLRTEARFGSETAKPPVGTLLLGDSLPRSAARSHL